MAEDPWLHRRQEADDVGHVEVAHDVRVGRLVGTPNQEVVVHEGGVPLQVLVPERVDG